MFVVVIDVLTGSRAERCSHTVPIPADLHKNSTESLLASFAHGEDLHCFLDPDVSARACSSGGVCTVGMC